MIWTMDSVKLIPACCGLRPSARSPRMDTARYRRKAAVDEFVRNRLGYRVRRTAVSNKAGQWAAVLCVGV
jgi:hypothetical protein